MLISLFPYFKKFDLKAAQIIRPANDHNNSENAKNRFVSENSFNAPAYFNFDLKS